MSTFNSLLIFSFVAFPQTKIIRISVLSFLKPLNIFGYLFGQFLSLGINVVICSVNSCASKYIFLSNLDCLSQIFVISNLFLVRTHTFE